MLENKLKISNEVELAKEEERITKLKALELFDTKKYMILKLEHLMVCLKFINIYFRIYMNLQEKFVKKIFQKEILGLLQAYI